MIRKLWLTDNLECGPFFKVFGIFEALEGGVVTVVAEETTNPVAFVLYSSESERRDAKMYDLLPKKTILDRKLKLCWFESAVCV